MEGELIRRNFYSLYVNVFFEIFWTNRDVSVLIVRKSGIFIWLYHTLMGGTALPLSGTSATNFVNTSILRGCWNSET